MQNWNLPAPLARQPWQNKNDVGAVEAAWWGTPLKPNGGMEGKNKSSSKRGKQRPRSNLPSYWKPKKPLMEETNVEQKVEQSARKSRSAGIHFNMPLAHRDSREHKHQVSPQVARKSLHDSAIKLEANFYNQYSLDDLRRFTKKLLDLDIVKPHEVHAYIQADASEENSDRVLCMYDSKIKWTTYNIKNQDFTFPHFMKDPVYLSRGGFGVVVKCLRYGNEPVAVKKVEVPDARNREMALRLLRELVVMKQAKKCNQRHICKIIDIFGDPRVQNPDQMKHIFIVMPLYKPGAMDNVRVSSPEMFKTIAGHTLSALHFLHRHKLMHRDIKKDNIFYDAAKNRAYLADLGQARTWNAKQMSGNGEVGTRCYVSPEILQGHKYDYKSDVYSLGQTWYEILCLGGSEEWCLYPWKRSGGSEHIRMQYAMDPRVNKSRKEGSTEPHARWAAEKWAALRTKAEQWQESTIVSIIEHTLLFDPRMRADTTKLFEIPYFFPFVSDETVMDLTEVETHNYTEIKKRIFDLQHGSCRQQDNSPAARKSGFSKMCSLAVQYFNEDNGGDSEDVAAAKCNTKEWWNGA